jgi:hypothetical protein
VAGAPGRVNGKRGGEDFWRRRSRRSVTYLRGPKTLPVLKNAWNRPQALTYALVTSVWVDRWQHGSTKKEHLENPTHFTGPFYSERQANVAKALFTWTKPILNILGNQRKESESGIETGVVTKNKRSERREKWMRESGERDRGGSGLREGEQSGMHV